MGPAPQIKPPEVGLFGEKNRLRLMSPKPNWDPAPGKMSFWWISGAMVREIRFQSSLR